MEGDPHQSWLDALLHLLALPRVEEGAAWATITRARAVLLDGPVVHEPDVAMVPRRIGEHLASTGAIELAAACMGIALDQLLRTEANPAEVAAVRERLDALRRAGARPRLGSVRLDTVLGRGGMGTVWRASGEGGQVAVKVIPGESSGTGSSQQASASLERELHKVAGLHHPAIVDVLDTGRVPPSAAALSGGELVAGSPWVSMDLVDGGTLRDLRGRMDWPTLRDVLHTLLSAPALSGPVVLERSFLIERHAGDLGRPWDYAVDAQVTVEIHDGRGGDRRRAGSRGAVRRDPDRRRDLRGRVATRLPRAREVLVGRSWTAWIPVVGMLLLVASRGAFAQEPPVDVRLVGVAQDAKGGAVVLIEGAPVYLEGVDAWPEGLRGAVVRVVGATMAQRPYLPEATVGPDGAVSQGVEPGTESSVITEPSWTALGFLPPWSVRYDDGSHNLTVVARRRLDEPITWSYRPMTPAESSSGSFDGGSPAAGQLDEAAGFVLWQRLQGAIAAGAPVSDGGRAMGTGLLTLTEGDTETRVLLTATPAQQLADALRAWRAGDGPVEPFGG